jgi:glyceraldehyde 3-phosphate dehydrogenase
LRTREKDIMSIRIGLNGFGRIGRCVARAAAANPNIDIVGINDLSDVNLLAHLLQYDSVHGHFDGTVEVVDGDMIINGDRTRVFAERNPADLPWGEVGADIVLECTGIFRNKETAGAHLAGGAKKVIISAPGNGEVDGTFVMGVNHEQYDGANHHVISNASCTTNCLAPVAKVLNDTFGIEQGLMTTIHAYTNDQSLLDGIHKDWRRARAGAMSMVPTSTGAAKAVGLVLPELNGKLNGFAIRVPTPDVSMVDLTVQTTKAVTTESINAAIAEAAEGPLKGFLKYTEIPLVSMDYTGDPHSSIFDAPMTRCQGDHMAKIVSWYDNEWGYSNRMVDLAVYVASKM